MSVKTLIIKAVHTHKHIILTATMTWWEWSIQGQLHQRFMGELVGQTLESKSKTPQQMPQFSLYQEGLTSYLSIRCAYLRPCKSTTSSLRWVRRNPVTVVWTKAKQVSRAKANLKTRLTRTSMTSWWPSRKGRRQKARESKPKWYRTLEKLSAAKHSNSHMDLQTDETSLKMPRD